MALSNEARQQVDYYVGTMVENTTMRGEKTLFIVGTKPLEEILELATKHNIKHLYFGSNQSFHPTNPYDWNDWDSMIKPLLVKDFYVSLVIDVEYTRDLHEQSWCEFNNFTPIISVKIPHTRLYNYNTTIKIDDTSWGDTNPGVWCHPLSELMRRSKFTAWKDYDEDQPVWPGEETE